MIHNMSNFLKPFILTVYAISLSGNGCPPQPQSSNVSFGPTFLSILPCPFALSYPGLYFASAVAYDAHIHGWASSLNRLEAFLFFWIILNSIQNLKRELNDQEEKSILKQLVRILAGTAVVLFPVSLVYHLYQVPSVNISIF